MSNFENELWSHWKKLNQIKTMLSFCKGFPHENKNKNKKVQMKKFIYTISL